MIVGTDPFRQSCHQPARRLSEVEIRIAKRSIGFRMARAWPSSPPPLLKVSSAMAQSASAQAVAREAAPPAAPAATGLGRSVGVIGAALSSCSCWPSRMS